MKRAIVVSVRISKDKTTSEDNAWVTVALMPTKMTNGNLFYPKSSDISVSTCAGAIKAPDKFTKYQGLKLGDIVDIHYALNEFTKKPFVNDITLVKSSPYKESDLIV